MDVRDGLLYFTSINKVKIHYTSTVIAHSQSQSLPLKCHMLTAPNCWVHKVYTICTHFQGCPFQSMHKVVYKYYIGCSVCLKCALKDMELYICMQQFRDGIVYTFPFYRTLQVLKHIIIKVYGELKLLKVL